jgi:hypothetical protein
MNQNIVNWNLCTCHPHPHSWTYSAVDPTVCPVQLTTGDTDSAPLPALSCSHKRICEDQLWQQEAPAHSTVHTVLIICSADILSNANMLTLLHQSVCLGSPYSPAQLLRCLAWPLPPVFNMGQESCIISHIMAISPSCWPAQTPWCTTLLRSITGYFAPTQTSVLISLPNNLSQPCWSDQPNTLTQEIPPSPKKNMLRSLPEPSLSTANLLTHSLNPLPSSKTQPTNAKTPVLTELYSNGYELCLANRIHECPVCALPDVLVWWKPTSHIPLTLGLLIHCAQLITWTERKSKNLKDFMPAKTVCLYHI